MESGLVIANFPRLETITFKPASFESLESLQIYDNRLLRSIIIEDGDEYEENGESYDDGCFDSLTTAVIKSTFIND